MKKNMNLSTKILLGLIIGIALGLVIEMFELTSLLTYIVQPIGTVFLNLMKMVILPLILCTLIASITNVGDMQKLGFLGKSTVLYYLGTTLVAAFIGVVMAVVFKPGAGVTLTATNFVPPAESSLIDLLVGIIPTNPFKSLVEGNTLQIIVFGTFIGIAVNSIGEKADNIKDFFTSFADVMYKIVEMIMIVTPIAVCALIADLVATNGWDVLASLIKLILVVVGASLIQCVFVYGGSVKFLGKINPLHFFKTILPAQMLSFSTASSAATLPISMKCAQEGLGVSKTVSNFVLNLGSTINMDGGAIYQAVCAVFIAQIYGIDLSGTQIIIVLITASLASIGAAAIPGTVIVMMTMVLSSIGLPLEAIALIAGVDRILDMITTSVNVTGDIAACAFVAQREKNNDKLI